MMMMMMMMMMVILMVLIIGFNTIYLLMFPPVIKANNTEAVTNIHKKR
jgi:hypothetical protein